MKLLSVLLSTAVLLSCPAFLSITATAAYHNDYELTPATYQPLRRLSLGSPIPYAPSTETSHDPLNCPHCLSMKDSLKHVEPVTLTTIGQDQPSRRLVLPTVIPPKFKSNNRFVDDMEPSLQSFQSKPFKRQDSLQQSDANYSLTRNLHLDELIEHVRESLTDAKQMLREQLQIQLFKLQQQVEDKRLQLQQKQQDKELKLREKKRQVLLQKAKELKQRVVAKKQKSQLLKLQAARSFVAAKTLPAPVAATMQTIDQLKSANAQHIQQLDNVLIQLHHEANLPTHKQSRRRQVKLLTQAKRIQDQHEQLVEDLHELLQDHGFEAKHDSLHKQQVIPLTHLIEAFNQRFPDTPIIQADFQRWKAKFADPSLDKDDPEHVHNYIDYLNQHETDDRKYTDKPIKKVTANQPDSNLDKDLHLKLAKQKAELIKLRLIIDKLLRQNAVIARELGT